jgi:hypothetical protein
MSQEMEDAIIATAKLIGWTLIVIAIAMLVGCGPCDCEPTPGDADTAHGDGAAAPDPCAQRFGASTLVEAQACESIWGLEVTGSDLTALSLPNLHQVVGRSLPGFLTVEGNPSLVAIDLPNLERIEGAVSITSNPALASIGAPKLAITDEDGSHTALSAVYVEGNTALRSLSLPGLKWAYRLQVGGNGLAELHLGALRELTELDINDEPDLAAISMPAIECIRDARIEGAPLLRECDLDDLRRAAGQSCSGRWAAETGAACE